MSDSLDPRDELLTERLAALGHQPVPAALQSEHLTAMSSVVSGRSFRTSLASRLKVGAGVLAGFLLGASGLASVGGLGPLQPIVAERAAEVANVDLPQGPKDKAAKAAKAKAAKSQGEGATNKIWGAAAGCPEQGEFRNRGAFLKAAKDAERDDDAATTEMLSFADARESDCGKGLDAEGDVIEPTDEDATEQGKPEESPAQNDGAGKSDDEHGKATAPGQEDKAEPGDKAQGPKDGAGDEADEKKSESAPAGPPATAGESGVVPPVEDPADETPAPAADGAAENAGGEV